jgi:hypothetical protein
MATKWLKQVNDTHNDRDIGDINNDDDIEPLDTDDDIGTDDDSDTDDDVDVEPLDTITGSGFDNIKGLSINKENNKKNRKKNKKKNDMPTVWKIIKKCVLALASLYLAYNLIFNITDGDVEIPKINDGNNAITMLFTKIVNFVTTCIAGVLNFTKNITSYFGYKTIFILFLVVSNLLLRPFLSNIIRFFKGLSKQKSKNIIRYLFLNFKKQNKLISVLFFFFLLKAIYTLATEKSGPITAFFVANPFLSLLALFLYVVFLYPITIPLASFAIYCVLIYYCFFTMIHKYFAGSLGPQYSNASSFSELLTMITDLINNGTSGIKDLHYIYLFAILLSLIPMIAKIHSGHLQAGLSVILTALLSLCLVLKYPDIYDKISSFFSSLFVK